MIIRSYITNIINSNFISVTFNINQILLWNNNKNIQAIALNVDNSMR